MSEASGAMATCGPYEVIIDAHGQVLAIGERLALLTGLAAADLVGRPVARWLRGPALAGPLATSSALELTCDNRASVHGLGVRVVDGERATLTFVPEATRADTPVLPLAALSPLAALPGAAVSPLAALPRAPRARSERPPESDQRALEVGRELQDALTGIIGFAGLVPVAPTPHRRKFYVDQVVSQAERVRRLVQAFEPGGRGDGRGGESGSASPVRPADLGVELTRALSGLRASLERGGVSFDIELPSEPLWAHCGIRQVGDLVTALIQRATLQQRRDYQANEVVLTVRRGPGQGGLALIEIVMTGADQPHVLMRERFGTDEPGASLSMSESELRVGLQGLRRQGGHFTLGQDAEREEVRLTLTLPSATAPRQADKLRTPVPLEILVVDDDPMLGELYQEMLQVAGHAVTACRSIFAAREALRAQRFDAIVAEFQLKDGLLSELWAMASQVHPELASRLVIATRDARDPRLIEWASQQNTPILAKPFSAGALQEQLALLL